MFDANVRNFAFDAILKTISIWITEANYQCAAAFINMTEELPLNNGERKALSQVIRIYDSFFQGVSKYSEMPRNKDAGIPDRFMIDTPSAFTYVIVHSVLNFIEAGLYSSAYDIMMSFSSIWPEMYAKAVATVASHPKKDDFVRWCATHSMVGMDIAGTKRLDYDVLVCIYDKDGFQKTESSEFPMI